MLIKNIQILKQRGNSVRIEGDRITAIGLLTRKPNEEIIDGNGRLLLPSLNDHHIHLLSYATANQSLACGPDQIRSEAELIKVLDEKSSSNYQSWIRGIGYHESVAGDIDKHWLDKHTNGVPTRIQHRSGRLWIINSATVSLLNSSISKLPKDVQVELPNNGRLFDNDHLLNLLTKTSLPNVVAASRELAGYGVTGINDMTPRNDCSTAKLFEKLQKRGELLQTVKLSGSIELTKAKAMLPPDGNIYIGSTKIHLKEVNLPQFTDLCQIISDSHESERGVAIHCVTELELVFALSAFREAGTKYGDRIEHASMVPPDIIHQLYDLDIQVVTQPNFIRERGAQYHSSIDKDQHSWLYRCRTYLKKNIKLAGGTDAPFGSANPWDAMKAAVDRTTRDDQVIGPNERLTPTQALNLFLGSLDEPAKPREIAIGEIADICLIDKTWEQLKSDLSQTNIKATFHKGKLIYNNID